MICFKSIFWAVFFSQDGYSWNGFSVGINRLPYKLVTKLILLGHWNPRETTPRVFHHGIPEDIPIDPMDHMVGWGCFRSASLVKNYLFFWGGEAVVSKSNQPNCIPKAMSRLLESQQRWIKIAREHPYSLSMIAGDAEELSSTIRSTMTYFSQLNACQANWSWLQNSSNQNSGTLITRKFPS